MISFNQKAKTGATRRAVLWIGTALCLVGGVAKAETLADAMVFAYQGDPALKAQRANLRALDAGVAVAKSGMLPSFDVRGSAGKSRFIDDSFGVTREPVSLGVALTQPLYDGGRTANNVEEAEANVRAGRMNGISAEQELLLNVVRVYIGVLRAEEAVNLARANVGVISEQLAAANARFQVGEGTRTDVAQAESRLAAARARLTQRTGEANQARQSYLRVVGKLPEGLQPPPPLPELPATLPDALAIARAGHPALAAAREQEAAASSAVRASMAGGLPQVTLRGEATRGMDGEGFNQGWGNFARATLNLTMPIFDGGRTDGQVRRAQATVDQRRNELHVVSRRVDDDVAQAWETLASARAQIVSTREQIAAAEIAYQGVVEESKVGTRTTIDVLNAEQEVLDARFALLDAQSSEYVAAYRLLSAIGRLTTRHLGLGVEPYDPNVNYEASANRLWGYDKTEDTRWRHMTRP